MTEAEAWRHLVGARVARLGTLRPGGAPHLVPVVFAVEGTRVLMAVDDKPKRTTSLQRLANIEADPRLCLLVDHYEEDWRRLWWVRADGRGRVVESGRDFESAVAALAAKYETYRTNPPGGPAVVAEIDRISGWSPA